MRRIATIAVVSVGASLLLSAPAAAAPAGWASWEDWDGTSNDFSVTMQQQAAGFPAAAVATNSTSGASVGVVSGASAYLQTQTPPGAVYGSSQDQPYLNLRPQVTNGGPPSETVYSFERATPATGWTFVLGDIDADAVAIRALGADGTELTAAELGFQSTFNYCAPDITPRPSTCSGSDGLDLPEWDPATGTLTGNAAAADTAGASAWFEPTVPITELTFVYAQRSGSPVYQTWFSSLAYDLSGAVDAPDAIREGLEVELVDGSGTVVGRTTTSADGTYAFPGYATYADYEVRLVVPDDFEAVDGSTRTVDLSTADQTGVDFALAAAAATGDVTGTVSDEAGDPVADATVTLTDADGNETSATSGDDGTFALSDLPPGDYEAVIVPPEGYEVVGSSIADVTLDATGSDIVLDFTLRLLSDPPPPGADDPDADPVRPVATPVTTLPSVGGAPLLALAGGAALTAAGAGLLRRRR